MSEKFTSSTARVIAERGNTFKATVMQIAEEQHAKLDQLEKELSQHYWALHRQASDHNFKPGDSIPALAKLGQLAEALEAVSKARSALNTVRCF